MKNCKLRRLTITVRGFTAQFLYLVILLYLPSKFHTREMLFRHHHYFQIMNIDRKNEYT